MTLPRLELCAAPLLSRFYTATKLSLPINFNKIYLWSDSTVTLHWINTQPHLLKIFISNRVAEIQKLTEFCEWRHVASQYNPANLVSRGQMPQEFVESQIWKNGPSWLSREPKFWPLEKIQSIEIPEKRTTIVFPISIKENFLNQALIENCGSIIKLKSTIAYILRFIFSIKNRGARRIGFLTAIKLEESNKLIIQLIQASKFSKEIYQLKRGDLLSQKSRLLSLNPFLDEQGILRVGDKLINSDLSEDQKHPVTSHRIRRVVKQISNIG